MDIKRLQQINGIVVLNKSKRPLSDYFLTSLAGDIPLRYRACIYLNNGKFNQDLADEFEDKVKQLKYDGSLFLQNNDCGRILKCLSNVSFPQLKKIFLRKNKIVSIQNLSNIALTNLQSLCLDQNLITSVKSLRKCDFPKLSQIMLNDNQIPETMSLSQMLLTNLKSAYFDQFLDRGCCLSNDMGWLCKIDSNSLKKVELNGRTRIRNQRFAKVRQRFA